MRTGVTTGIVGSSLLLLLSGCGDPDDPTDPPDTSAATAPSTTNTPTGTSNSSASSTATPTGSVGSSTAPADSGSTSAPPTDSSGGSETTGGGMVGETGVVRFAAFGDTGEGNEAQLMVANAAEVICAERGCDFALLLGDNFYDTGVTGTDDPQFIDKFEDIYEGLDMPFYVILGNHDYGQLANDWNRGNYQVEYSAFSEKWTMPYFWYSFTSESGGTEFFGFDTSRMMWNHDVGDQRDWMTNQLAASTATWKVAFAHHPYLSNGAHGNAGNYEGIPGLPIVSGVEVQEFIDDLVCGNAQMYISGHDHNRQMFDPVCGTYFFVSGASAKTSDFEYRNNNPTIWDDDTREGFLWVEIQGDQMTAAFYDFDGNLDHEIQATL